MTFFVREFQYSSEQVICFKKKELYKGLDFLSAIDDEQICIVFKNVPNTELCKNIYLNCYYRVTSYRKGRGKKNKSDYFIFFLQKITDEEEIKEKIRRRFDEFVKNRTIDTSSLNQFSDGKEGYWLETQMGVKHNSKNGPDIRGFEMKKDSKKITFGDFSASEYLFSQNQPIIEEYNCWANGEGHITRKEFIKYFGNPNYKKHGRLSWSGKCVPKYGEYNECGQGLFISEENDIFILYDYEKDEREHNKDKNYEFLKGEPKIIAVWTSDKMRNHINNKYNSKGFFICVKEGEVYTRVCFGKPFDFDYFIQNIKNGNIIFDSGMYNGNPRNYSEFRSKNRNFWSSLISDEP
jgi:MvaI/BcnI restriction endonuclease family